MHRRHLLAGIAILAAAAGIRWRFLCGPILGDDYEELVLLLNVLASGPLWTDQLHLRFAGWLFNYLAFLLFGVSETALLLPNVLVSSTLGVLAYALLVRWGHGPLRGFLGGLFVASAPFEVVLGTVRANDLYLAWFLALGFTLLVVLEERPVLQGIAVAACLWLGFYVKLWALYVVPAIGLYYLAGRRWRAAAAFLATSAALHGATSLLWAAKLGTPLPFVTAHAATYAVTLHDLSRVLLIYPSLLFRGSEEFGTTLFGAVPYVLVTLLLVKAVAHATLPREAPLRFGRVDGLLLAFYGTFVLLLEFFPNGFRLDAYYSVPRIFRYLAPLSFPLTLHAAAMLLDVARSTAPRWRPGAAALALFAPLLAANLHDAARATGPGRIHRANLQAVLRDVRETAPPQVVAEATLAGWLRDLYVGPDDATEVVAAPWIFAATAHERWLRDHEAAMPEGTLLITGLSSYVHYGAHGDGFRLRWFDDPLDPRWKLFREYGELSYLPRPEPARLWRLERDPGDPGRPLDAVEDLSGIRDVTGPADLFAGGMARYDASDYAGARVYFRKLLVEHPAEAEDAAFFYAASFFRETDWRRARREFKRLLRRYPRSRWVPAAHWHVAMCDKNTNRVARAAERFRYVIRRFPEDAHTASLAAGELGRLRFRRGGLLRDAWTGRAPR